jgi:hypothetical protein
VNWFMVWSAKVEESMASRIERGLRRRVGPSRRTRWPLTEEAAAGEESRVILKQYSTTVLSSREAFQTCPASINPRQITHHVQYINADTARLLSHKLCLHTDGMGS